MNFGVLIGGEDFLLDFFWSFGVKIFYIYANIFAIFLFKFNIFKNDGILAVADD